MSCFTTALDLPCYHLGLEEEPLDFGRDLIHWDVRAAVEELGIPDRR